MPEQLGRRLIEGETPAPRDESTRPGVSFPTPDVPIDKNDLRYVAGYIFPFHFKHPVTGKETSEARRNSTLKPRPNRF